MLNTDFFNTRTAWTTIDNELHKVGDQLSCIYSTDPSRIGQQLQVVGPIVQRKTELDRPRPLDRPDPDEIGQSLVSGIPHLAWATAKYPEHLLAHYRLAATLSMLAEDLRELWRFYEEFPPLRMAPGGSLSHLRAGALTALVAEAFREPARHRSEWPDTKRPARGFPDRVMPAKGLRWVGATSWNN